MRYEISNAKTQPISVDLTQAGLDFALNDTRIIEESQKSQRTSSDAARWTVNVPANGSLTFTATFETRYCNGLPNWSVFPLTPDHRLSRGILYSGWFRRIR